MPFSEHELRRRFPNISVSTLRANSAAALPANNPQPVKGRTLEHPMPRKEKSCKGSANRTRIQFTVYAIRPADWDGYHIKELQDLLCRIGYLEGDGWDQLQGEVISEKVHSKAEERTEITILYPTEIQIEQLPDEPTRAAGPNTRQKLLEQLWSQVHMSWNREAFNAFMETMSDADLQHYIQVGR